MTIEPGDLLTPDEVADCLSVQPETVRRWIHRGLLPAVRMPSGRLLVNRADLGAVLEPVKAGGPAHG